MRHVQVTPVQLPAGSAGFHVIRDDLTHPLLGGNKFRKLDGLWSSVAQVKAVKDQLLREHQAPC